jgi:hypothetical protein
VPNFVLHIFDKTTHVYDVRRRLAYCSVLLHLTREKKSVEFKGNISWS